ncbi:MAG: hypothetical protein CL808_01580 [Citromicrobium sp.]|nr:hypothetical protein [Citromicrobium sp.]
MPNFIVNTTAQSNGDHEVHNTTAGCSYMPSTSNQKNLGTHSDCHGAVTEAKKTYSQSNGCYYCCNACHTS